MRRCVSEVRRITPRRTESVSVFSTARLMCVSTAIIVQSGASNSGNGANEPYRDLTIYGGCGRQRDPGCGRYDRHPPAGAEAGAPPESGTQRLSGVFADADTDSVPSVAGERGAHCLRLLNRQPLSSPFSSIDASLSGERERRREKSERVVFPLLSALCALPFVRSTNLAAQRAFSDSMPREVRL